MTNASQEEETRDNDRAIHVERQPEPPVHLQVLPKMSAISQS